jgi:aromatic-amino-acid transaminase
MYEHLPIYAGDPILSLHEAFLADPRPNKVSLSIGLYFDEQGRLPVLDSVRKADAKLREQERPSGYLPIEGAPEYRAAVQRLVFGADSVAVKAGRIATIQGVGGSGAIRIGADLIKAFMPGSGVWISDPTWDNHESLMQGAGLKVARYPYYDAASNGLRYEEMLACFATLPAASVVLMQPCCHNPTGIDLANEQWNGVIQVMKDRALVPFLDMAYQGFGDGIEEDAWAVRAMVDAGLCPLVTNSFSKNFSLYGERCGGLSVVCPTADEADRVLGQLKAGIRRVYSSPPLHGERLVATVLDTPALQARWVDEVTEMRERIKRMRVLLAQRLTAGLPGMSVDFLTEQHGMFSYTGLTAAEVDTLRDKHGIYLVRSGRMCVAGLNEGNVQAVSDALIVVLKARG